LDDEDVSKILEETKEEPSSESEEEPDFQYDRALYDADALEEVNFD
jgi:hypothetical protein